MAKVGESRRKTPKDGGLRSNFEKFKQISQQNTYLSRSCIIVDCVNVTKRVL